MPSVGMTSLSLPCNPSQYVVFVVLLGGETNIGKSTSKYLSIVYYGLLVAIPDNS